MNLNHMIVGEEVWGNGVWVERTESLRTVYIPFDSLHRGNSEISLLSARRRIRSTFILFYFILYIFFAAAAPPTPYRESVKRLPDSSWPLD